MNSNSQGRVITMESNNLPVSQLESTRFKINQIIESINALSRTIEGGNLNIMPPWPDILTKYNLPSLKHTIFLHLYLQQHHRSKALIIRTALLPLLVPLQLYQLSPENHSQSLLFSLHDRFQNLSSTQTLHLFFELIKHLK